MKRTWALEDFYSGETNAPPCPEVVDLTGRPRVVVFGPYAPLEAGLWRLTLSFHLCPDAGRASLAGEFGVIGHYARAEWDRLGPGRHSVRLEQYFPEDTARAEIRLFVMRPTFHGELRGLEAQLERIGDGPNPFDGQAPPT